MQYIDALAYTVLRQVVEHPDLKEHIEETACISFHHHHGYEPTTLKWEYEAAHDWTDPDTGEVLHIPDQHTLIVEGYR